jgi:chromate reductase
MNVTIADISQIPLYNEDVRQQGFPPPVETLRRQIKEADALLFACPEYNYSMTGVLKNAIDWASRPPDQPFAGKPCAIIGAAAGMAGSARAQYDLRRSCVFLDMHPINKPEVLIGQAQTKFDADGNFTDEAGRNFIRDLMVALAAWTRQVAKK